jgi:hypothetical protein
MGIATIISLAGNIQLALPGHAYSPFAWLEAVAPPLIVLSTAHVLKEQVLDTIEQRHADERAFQCALVAWQAATANPENHPQWAQFYANALRDELRKANYRRQEALAALTTADWRMLVYREFQTEQWYIEPVMNGVPIPEESEIEHVPLASQIRRNGNGIHPE